MAARATPIRLIAVADAGIADVVGGDLEEGATIQLQAWGAIEGTAYEGTEPAANRTIVASATSLSPLPPSVEGLTEYTWHAQTDANGAYRIERVKPGAVRVGLELSRVDETGSGFFANTNAQIADVLPGQTAKRNLEPVGTIVRARLVLTPEMSPAASGFAFLHHIPRQRQALGTFKDGTFVQTEEERAQAEAYLRSEPPAFASLIAEDGSVTFYNVPAWTWNLSASLYTDAPLRRLRDRKLVGLLRHMFTLPREPTIVNNEESDPTAQKAEAKELPVLDLGELAPQAPDEFYATFRQKQPPTPAPTPDTSAPPGE